MSYAQTVSVEVTTNGDGDATAYSPHLTGLISQIRYVKTDFANGVDFDVTVNETGQVVWDQDDVNDSATVAPRQAAHTTAGVAATYDGTYPVLEPIAVANARIKIVVGSGGATKTGTFHITVV